MADPSAIQGLPHLSTYQVTHRLYYHYQGCSQALFEVHKAVSKMVHNSYLDDVREKHALVPGHGHTWGSELLRLMCHMVMKSPKSGEVRS